MGRDGQLHRSLPLTESEAQRRLSTWVELARMVHVIERRVVELLATCELTLPQFDVLATLRYSEGVTQQELAARLLVTKGNVCGLLDRLERADWVERRADPQDARANRLHLTAPGRRKIDGVLPLHDRLINELFAPATPEQLVAVRLLVSKVGNS